MDLGTQIKFLLYLRINKIMNKVIKIKRKIHTPLRRPPRLSKKAYKFGIKSIKKKKRSKK